MQPKRILISLLVVILALLSVGTFVSAEDGTTLDMAVEVSSSTALSDSLCITTDGDLVTVSVTIKSNPGVSLAHFDILFDPAYMKPSVNEDSTVKWTSSGIFDSSVTETVTVNYNTGKLGYTLYSASSNVTATGKVFTCTFNVLKHGNTALKLDMKSNDVVYIKADGTWSEEGVDHVNISYNGNAAATAVPVMVHTLGSTYTTTPATCTAGGQKVYSCTTCSEKVSIPDGTQALGHTPVELPSVPVSCVQDGLTAGSKCSVCDTILTPQLVAVEKSDEHHTLVKDPAVAPTCSATGLTEGEHCSTCNKVTKEQTEVAKTAHTYGEWATVTEATSSAEGSREKTCTICGDKVTESIPKLESDLPMIIITVAITAVVVAGAAVVIVFVLKKKKVV